MKALLNAALAFLEAILSRFSWWEHVKAVLEIAIIASELTPDSGPEKKNAVIDAVIKFFEDREIKLPLPEWLFRILLGLAIDIVINTLNNKYGHDWLSKLKEG